MSAQIEIDHFLRLREAVAHTFLQNNTPSSSVIEEWKGQDILDFQDDLIRKVNGQVSEKWFYTYFKNPQPEKIPRIDMLNLLSQYAGYQNWSAFKQPVENSEKETLTSPARNRNLTIYFILVATALMIWNYFMFFPDNDEVSFCFYDQDRNEAIKGSTVVVEVLNTGESPRSLVTDDRGCVSWESAEELVRFAVRSPYYKSDTIVRALGQAKEEVIYLKTDDYALMLLYFSNSQVDDWKRRREELKQMIHQNAVIYQVFGQDDYGVDVYTKQEFINKLTLPTSSLRNLDVIETRREDGQIVHLKFKIRSHEEH